MSTVSSELLRHGIPYRQSGKGRHGEGVEGLTGRDDPAARAPAPGTAHRPGDLGATAPKDATDSLVTLDAEVDFSVTEQPHRNTAPTLVIGGAKNTGYRPRADRGDRRRREGWAGSRAPGLGPGLMRTCMSSTTANLMLGFMLAAARCGVNTPAQSG
jgi:hypothetical protein